MNFGLKRTLKVNNNYSNQGCPQGGRGSGCSAPTEISVKPRLKYQKYDSSILFCKLLR